MLFALECENRKHLLYTNSGRTAQPSINCLVRGYLVLWLHSLQERDFIQEQRFHCMEPLRSQVTEKIVKAPESMLHPVTKLNLECLFVKENRCNKTVLKWERLYLNPLFHIQRFLPLTGKKYKRWFNIQSSCFCLCLWTLNVRSGRAIYPQPAEENSGKISLYWSINKQSLNTPFIRRRATATHYAYQQLGKIPSSDVVLSMQMKT